MAVQAFTNHHEVLAAIRVVQRFLTEGYIVEECAQQTAGMGCASCQAIGIRSDLEMLAGEIVDDLSRASRDRHNLTLSQP